MMPVTLQKGLAPGVALTEETVELVRAAMADTTRAITMASGMIGYELEAPAKVIVPVITPLVNLLPRRRGSGIDIVHWKAITSFDTARNWGVVADSATPSQNRRSRTAPGYRDRDEVGLQKQARKPLLSSGG